MSAKKGDNLVGHGTSILAVILVFVSPLLLLFRPYWASWPGNWKRFQITGTKRYGENGIRIIFLPGGKDIGPFIPNNIQITKTWLQWKIYIWGDDPGSTSDCVMILRDRMPGESYPHPRVIMEWACQQSIDGFFGTMSSMHSRLKSRGATEEKIREYVPGYVKPEPKVLGLFPDDY